MRRRNFVTAIFGGLAGSAILPGKAVAGNSFEKLEGLTPAEQEVMAELGKKHMIAIPSRKSLLFTEELRKKRDILKRLVHKNLVMIDYSIADPKSETSETCMVYYLPPAGKTPLDCYGQE